MSDRPTPVASRRHTWTILVVLVLVTLASASTFRDRGAEAVAASHATSYVVLILCEWLLFFGVWRGLKAAGTPISAVLGQGFRPRFALLRSFVVGLAVLPLVRIIAWGAGRALVRAFHAPVDADSARVAAALAPHGLLEQALWLALSLSAGICEEFVYRGYLQRQFGAWFGSTFRGVLASALVFGLTHAYQGPWQVITIAVGFGLPFGLLAWVRRGLAPGMVAHALQDALAGLFARG